MFRARNDEIAGLSALWASSTGTLSHVTGPRGIGKTTLVGVAGAHLPVVHLHCPPVPGPTQREILSRDLARAWPHPEADGRTDASPSTWGDFLDEASERMRSSDVAGVLVLDDAHRLTESRQRVGAEIAEALRRADRRERPLHLVLVGRGGGLPELPAKAGRSVDLHLALGPLSLREALPFLPGDDGESRIGAYAVFGGNPARLRLLDPEASLATNIRRLVLNPGARLVREGLDVLERAVQSPSRYVAILRSLALGATDWSRIHEGVSDLTKSGQVAPYLSRLAELGLVETRRSLDAGPRSRNRHYRIRDPFHQFWYRFVLGHVERLVTGTGTEHWAEEVRPELDAHIETVFPEVCRQFMVEGASERFGSDAREVGGLWGPDYDLPVSGLLAAGGAFHGKCVWAGEARSGLVRELDREIRETRYGFGRERRLRVIFSRKAPGRELERAAAKRENLFLVGPEEIAGSPRLTS